MFRIHFEPKGGYWCIQFLVWWFFWVTVKTPKTHDDQKVGKSLVVAQFDSYELACAYVEKKGIDVTYQYKDNSSLLTAAQVSQQVVQQELSSPPRRFRVLSGQ